MFKGETVWAFDVEEGPAGWGSMHFNTRDAEQGDAVLIVGVFPHYQRKGYRTLIRDWMAERAKKLGATSASIIVYKANDAHYKRVMREAHTEGSSWVYAGDVWMPPPGYGIFVRPFATLKTAP
jgi:GNAT superfamily N-acetyltransferase